MDSIVSMIERLRSEPGKRGLVTGNGWFLTKQSAAIYSTMPIDPSAKHKVPEDIPSRTHVEVVTGVIECPGVIETYTVGHSRDGEPERGLVIGRIGDGRRFIANTPQDRRLLEALMQEEHIGRSGRLTFHKGFHYFTPD
jgi:acetyl-CoA C-acetyltransferase